MYANLESVFPEHFNRSSEYNYYSKIKQRAILLSETVLAPTDEKEKEIEEINEWIVKQIKPKAIEKEEKALEKNYEELCILLSKHTNIPVKKMTVFEYYTLLDLIKKKKIQ